MTKIKCAIYVRKSTEKGLELEFNSLHNQEESCRNYILSQAFQCWEHYKTYTDGGISGGTMERPALKQMLNDIAAGLIQVVVVYKVDRLSRSIMDFHNMMREFDRHNCNFVSITQAFDTSTSMGKLTLNMLLSFAQFEREVSAERVRDKIRASKAKGFWTGGVPPLGYDVINKKLIPNIVEAETVCRIFEKYLELKSLGDLHHWCIENNITNKQWTTQKGETMGGTVFCKHALNNLLRNPVYIGRIRNKKTNETYTGLHNAIIPTQLFEAAQEMLSENNNRRTSRCIYGQYMLRGKIFDMAGNMFKTKSTSKSKTRHYCRPRLYLPASDIDHITCETMQNMLDANIYELIPHDIAQNWKSIDFANMTYEIRTRLLSAMLDKVVYNNNRLTFYVNIAPVDIGFQTPDYTNPNAHSDLPNVCKSNDGKQIIIERAIVIHNRVSTNQYDACGRTIMTAKENNLQLIRALAYGWKYKQLYERGMTASAIAKTEHRAERTVYKYLWLGYLSPKIISAIMDGNAPTSVDLQKLFSIATKYLIFNDQEKDFYSKI